MIKARLRREQVARWLVGALSAAYWIIFLTLGLFSLVWLLSLTRHSFGADYEIYLDAYKAARQGANPYYPYSIGQSFVNHPFVLVVVRVLFVTERLSAKVLWSGVSIAAWFGSLHLVLALLRHTQQEAMLLDRRVIAPVCLVSAAAAFGPFLETIAIGQVNAMALFFVLLSLYLHERGRQTASGACMGVAILLKTSPVLFLGYFVLLREWRPLVSATGVVALLSLLSRIPFPGDVVAQFVEILPRLSGEVHTSPYNMSFMSVVLQLLPGGGAEASAGMVSLANKLVLGLLLAVLAAVVWRCGSRTRSARIWLFACFQVLSVVFSPLAWYHHLSFLLLPLVLLLAEKDLVARLLGFGGLTLIQLERFFEHTIVWFPWPCLLAEVVVLVATLISWVRHSPGPGRPGMLTGGAHSRGCHEDGKA